MMVPTVVIGAEETKKIVETIERYFIKDDGCSVFITILKKAIDNKEYGVNILCRFSDEAIKETVDRLKGDKKDV